MKNSNLIKLLGMTLIMAGCALNKPYIYQLKHGDYHPDLDNKRNPPQNYQPAFDKNLSPDRKWINDY